MMASAGIRGHMVVPRSRKGDDRLSLSLRKRPCVQCAGALRRFAPTLRFLLHISRRDRHRNVATSSIGFGKTSVIRNRSHGRSGRRHSVGPPPARRCIPPRAVKYPEESFPDNVAEPIWEKASGTALYRDQLVCLGHDQAAWSRPASISSGPPSVDDR